MVEALLRYLGHAPSCLLDSVRERPDALITIDGQTIGVEVTTLTESASRQVVAPQLWTAEASRVVAAAQRMHEERTSRSLVVGIEFAAGWRPPKPSDREQVALKLCSLVDRLLHKPRRWTSPGEPLTERDPDPDVTSLYVDPNCGGPFGCWRPTLAGHVFAASGADVQATVARKEVELPTYLTAAPVVWLLIDCDVSGQGVALDVPAAEFSINTGFDRVFCTAFGRWQWLEVPVVR